MTLTEHQYYKEVNSRDGNYYRRWALAYGECTAELINQVLRSARHEEQAYNSCAGILHSCKGVPHGIVEEASRKCIEMHACKYSYFKRVLGTVANSSDSGGGKVLPSHENIRGKDFYK